MAPDKIYLCADAPSMYDWSNAPFEKGGNIEYIRKDALLEWANNWERLGQSEDFMYAVKTLVRHLNSM